MRSMTYAEPDGDQAQALDTFRKVVPYLWPKDQPALRRRVVWAMLALILAKLFTVTTPFFFKWIIDSFGLDNSSSRVVTLLALTPMTLVLAYGVGRVLMIGFAQLRDSIFASVGQHAVRSLALKSFEHLHKLSLRYHLDRRTGGLSRVIERGTKGVETVLRFSLFNTIPTLVEMALVGVIMAVWFNVWFALVTAGTVIFYIWFTYKATQWRLDIRRRMNDADTKANTKSVDSLLNYETVKYFGNEDHEHKRFDSSMKKYETEAIKTTTSLGWLNTGQAIIFSIGLCICMWMGAQGVSNGTLTIGDFVMINAFLIQLYIPLNFLGSTYRDIKQGLMDIENMFVLIDQEPEVQDKKNAPDLNVDKAALKFEDVYFSYDAERPILAGVSFNVPAGKTVAIVGPSGAGKSTLSRILFRFFDVSQGAIYIDDQNIAEVSQKSLRSQIGMVPQDTVLFNDTIAYNIRYGRVTASDEDVKQAAKLAQIDDFISNLPNGYDAMVGERGLKLSGGEKQRVAIARTILKDPPILMLDEATSALDSYTEKEIQHALEDISKDRTTLIIAHRLSTVVHADEIIVLDKGKIVERGTHKKLLAKKDGLYAGMWNRQREVDEARATLEED